MRRENHAARFVSSRRGEASGIFPSQTSKLSTDPSIAKLD